MASLNGKTLFITGGSRGIGLAIALRAARDGAQVAIAAKTAKPHPKLPGTIYSAAEAIEEAGGRALPIQTDVRDTDALGRAVEQAARHFGSIDVLINNASAISLTDTAHTPMKRFDLMHAVNARATFAASQACLPYLKRALNPHILTLSPPLNLDPRWFAPHVAYTLSKYGMSLCVLGMAEELKRDGVAVNALWPRTVIHTAALNNIPGVDANRCRKPQIVADAAHAILTRAARGCSGHFFVDEDVLRQEGISDFSAYAVRPGEPLLPDLFIGKP